VTNRTFTGGKSQVLTWDASGRLVGIVQRDSATNGFNWTAVYDGLGRRLRNHHHGGHQTAWPLPDRRCRSIRCMTRRWNFGELAWR